MLIFQAKQKMMAAFVLSMIVNEHRQGQVSIGRNYFLLN